MRKILILGLCIFMLACTKEDLTEVAKKGDVTLKIDGKDVTIPVEVMDIYLVDNHPDKYPETFHLHGESFAVAGSFPLDLRVGYGEDFTQMLERSVSIQETYNPDGHEDIDSYVDLPGGSSHYITGGTITVNKVLGPNPNGAGSVLEGKISLDLESKGTVDGTFRFLAKTWG